MEGNRRWIVWTAIGLGVLALLALAVWQGPRLVALVGGLPGPFGPAWAEAYGGPGEHWAPGRYGEGGPFHAGGSIGRAWGGWWLGGPPRIGGFLFWPFFLFGGPLNLLFLGLLVVLVVMLLNRPRGPGAPTDRGQGAPPDPETPLEVATSESR